MLFRAEGGAEAAPFDLPEIKAAMTPLDFSDTSAYSPAVEAYFRYYGMDAPGCLHRFGTFTSGPYTLAAHVYTVEGAKGTVFLAHGYYDHVGILKNIIHLCLQESLSVAAFDLPGHGLSSGEPAAIDSFEEYSASLRDFLSLCAPHLPRPWHAVGHSTGTAVVLGYLFSSDEQPFAAVVLLAPLVRSAYYHLSRVGHVITRPFIKRTMRLYRNASSDKAFLKFQRGDPLLCRSFPLKWAEAAYAWKKEFEAYAPRPLPLTIIQGTKDDVVDWRYNIPVIRKKVPGCEVIMIEGGRHQLMNEAEELKNRCLRHLGDCLTPNSR